MRSSLASLARVEFFRRLGRRDGECKGPRRPPGCGECFLLVCVVLPVLDEELFMLLVCVVIPVLDEEL